jgi:hypothetical protein
MILQTKRSYAEIMKIRRIEEMNKDIFALLNLTPESTRLEPFRLKSLLTKANNRLQTESEAK